MSESRDYIELGELVFLCLSGEADRDQIAQLEALLARDAQARCYYSEFLVIYAGLHQSPASLLGSVASDVAVSSGDPDCLDVPNPLKGTIQSVAHPRRPGESETANDDLQRRPFSEQEAMRDIESYARRQLEAFLDQQRREESLRRQPCRPGWDFGALALRMVRAFERYMETAAKVVKVGALVTAFVLVGLVVGLYIYANQTVAALTDSADAVWEMPLPEARLRRGWMRLERGFAQITFKTGAQIILQGPCEFELCSSNSMFLQEGRVTAQVPGRATGFSVSTPESRVIDFGTEFGLLTGGGHGDEVHVFEGSVRFKSARRRRSTRWDQPLRKGQAATIDITGQVHVQALKDRPRQFVRELPGDDEATPVVRVIPDANERDEPVVPQDWADPRLVGWWKFDEGAGTVAADSSGNGHTGTLAGPEWVAPGWNQKGYCLEFGHDDDKDHVDLGTMDVIGKGITITAWINPYTFRQHDARVISKAVTGATADGHWWMLGTNDGVHVRFRIKTDEGHRTLTLIGTEGALLAAGEWQFIAGRWDGRMASTFVGAVETAYAAKGGTAVATSNRVPVVIGNQPPNDPDGSRAWDGLIDDVRVYNYALTMEELDAVMTGAGPGTGPGTDSEPASEPAPVPEPTEELSDGVSRAIDALGIDDRSMGVFRDPSRVVFFLKEGSHG